MEIVATIDEELLGAFASGIAAANAIAKTRIKARFHPFLRIYTSRQTLAFGRMLKAKGFEPQKHRGKTYYDLSQSASAYSTFEEAWAYVEDFVSALPDHHVEYGVFFEGDEPVWFRSAYDKSSNYATVIRRGEPESKGG